VSCLILVEVHNEKSTADSAQASLIPPIERIEHISSDTEHIDWVLIVEKDVSLLLEPRAVQ
jgi:hypothetical protein